MLLTNWIGKQFEKSQFVPHHLTEAQKQQRTECCRYMAVANAQFVKTNVTGDGTWRFQYQLETKRQSTVSQLSKSKKNRFYTSIVKTQLIDFFDCQGIINKEFLPAGQTVNGKFCCDVLKRLLARICQICPPLKQTDSLFLFFDNARRYKATIEKRFLDKYRVTDLSHPQYSPDLSPSDVFLFPNFRIPY